MIEIVKASAGSGKTYKLAKTYIGLLLRSEDRYAYRHILAVTFTNKATEEMKSRILKELDILARTPESSPYFSEFLPLFENARALSNRAENILFDILHDYSAFSISTIDKFFQSTLKAFAREMGQFSSYQVDLDKKSLITESVDRLLDSLDESNGALLEWLRDSALFQLEQGKKANIEGRLLEVCSALKTDSYREALERSGFNEDELYSKENLKVVKNVLREHRNSYLQRVRTASGNVVKAFEMAGVPPNDTYRHFGNKFYDYAQINVSNFKRPTDQFLEKLTDSTKWFSKANEKKYLPLVDTVMPDYFNAFLNLFGEDYKVYTTVRLLESQLYGLGIASEFHKEFTELVREKNVINIDDSNAMLQKIIDGTDAPFIYEKLGVRYNNFLLDEFQDTSSIQWDNFKPLIKECDSNGDDSLIVGDVKQSIYRWRGSDWDLLAEGVKAEFPDADDSQVLSNNWRSLGRIIDFNNGFFPYAASRLDEETGSDGNISKLYGDVCQVRKNADQSEGVIDFTFCNPSHELEEILNTIQRLRSEGYAEYGQIAVLVRTNATGSKVASYLIDHNIPVISDDSLTVKSSIVVRRLSSLMHYVNNPKDRVNAFLAESLGIDLPTHYRSLSDLAEGILRGMAVSQPDIFEKDVLYIQSFMDAIQEWSSSNGNSLNEFLKYWDDSDLMISSPPASDSVRITTVHKSKGLEYPYVIFPFAEDVDLFKTTAKWCRPRIAETAFPTEADGLYHINLSGTSENTLFAQSYIEEKAKQYMDNLNLFYVALTRAEMGFHLISSKSSDGTKIMADLLFEYLNKNDFLFESEILTYDDDSKLFRFHCGTMPDFRRRRDKPNAVNNRNSSYRSYPLNTDNFSEELTVGERGRLKFSQDTVEFFTNTDKSQRLKGVVLHDILGATVCASDLASAIEWQLRNGRIDEEQAREYHELLYDRISSVQSKGWFPEDRSKVHNEASIIDRNGNVYRPDRVIIDGQSVTIIDYKFGEENESYLKQISRYAQLYSSMGYCVLSACLWYVYENKIIYL